MKVKLITRILAVMLCTGLFTSDSMTAFAASKQLTTVTAAESAAETETAADLTADSVILSKKKEDSEVSEAVSSAETKTAKLPETSVTEVRKESAVKVSSEESYTITDFKKHGLLKTITADYDHKPSLSNIKKQLPSTLKVKLDHQSKSTEIPVRWKCVGEDYASSEGHYFQFSPYFDKSYLLDSSIDLVKDGPYVVVDLGGKKASSKAGTDGIVSSVSSQTGLSSTQVKNQKTIFDYLTKTMKLNTAAACGVLANIYYESGYDPNCYGDHGTSYGICQWHNSRFTNLKNYCKNKGYDYKSLNGQLHFLEYELNLSSYVKTLNYLRSKDVSNNSTGAYNAAWYWCYYFEIPANRTSTSKTRGNYAVNSVWPVFKSTPAVVPGTESPETKPETEAETTKPEETKPEETKPPVIEIPKLGTPSISSLTNAASGISLSWTAVKDASGYYIRRGSSADKITELLATVKAPATQYTDKTAGSGKTYFYQIIAYKAESAKEILDIYRVNTDGLRYRKEPSLAGDKSGTLPNGGSFKCVRGSEVTADGYVWIKILVNGNYYYTAKSYLELQSAGSAPAETKSQPSAAKSLLRLSTVTNLKATGASDGITVSWSLVSGADTYVLYRKTSGKDFEKLATLKGANISSYKDKTAAKGVKYIYAARAVKGTSYSAISAEVTASIANPALAKPVIALKNVSTGIQISWKKIDGANGYIIYRGSSAIYTVRNGSTLSYIDTKASSGSNYSYTVEAIKANFSANEATTLSNLNYRTGAGTSYKIVGTIPKGTSGIQVVSGSETVADGYTWVKISYAGNTYFCSNNYLQMSSSAQISARSGKSAGKTLTYLACTGFTKSSVVPTGIYMSWTKVAGATGYAVYRKTPSTSYVKLGTVNGASTLTYIDTSAKVGYAYTYMVKAVNGSAMASYNTTMKLMKLATPALRSAKAVNGGIEVSWKSVSKAEGYYLYRKTAGSNWTRIAVISDAACLSYLDKTAVSGTSYTYTVRAFKKNGLSYYKTEGVSCKMP